MTNPLAWEAAAPNAYVWTSRAVDMLNEKPPALTARLRRTHNVLSCTIEGPCPRCDELISQTITLSAVTDTASDADEPKIAAGAAEPVPVVVSCICNGTHPGRPKGITSGCGINFKLLLPLDA